MTVLAFLLPVPSYTSDPIRSPAPIICRSPRGPFRRRDGSYRDLTCTRLTCPACMTWRARRIAWAIALARPSHSVMLTEVGDSWPIIRDNVDRLRRRLAARGVRLAWAWHVEENPQGTGNHIHGWLRGDAPAPGPLSEAALAAGMGGFCSVKPIRLAPGLPLAYGLKVPSRAASGYLTSWLDALRFVDLNGGWLVRSSHGFWLDSDGRRMTLKTAEAAAARALRSSARSSTCWAS